MAKLRHAGQIFSGEGRELLRMSKTEENPKPDLEWRKNFYVITDDRRILSKLQIKWKEGLFAVGGKRHDYGWKSVGKVKEGIDLPEYVEKIRVKLLAEGFQPEKLKG